MPDPVKGAQRRGAKAYLIASGVAQLFALVRYPLLARLLGPEQLGLAATLILTGQFFDMLSDTGSDRFLIQDSDGDDTSAQSLVHMVYAFRGVFTALALVVLAGPLAAWYKAPGLVPGFALLALSPLIAGFTHMDMRRQQRHDDFRAEGWNMFLSEGLNLVVTAIAAILLHSWVAAIMGLIARSSMQVLVSQMRADRPYRIGYSRTHAKRLARFAAPLIFNGILLFFGGQGDRVIVANQLGIAELGHYSAVLLLVYYPTATVIRYLSAIHLPRIARERGGALAPGHSGDVLGGQANLLSIAVMVGFVIVGPVAVLILYGKKFAVPVMVVAAIGVLQALRLVRVWPGSVALGLGQSGTVLATNIARLIAFPAAVAGAAMIGGLTGILAGFIVGEAVALALGVALPNRSAGVSLWQGFDRILSFGAVSVVTIAWAWLFEHPNLIGMAGLAAVSAGVGLWVVLQEGPTIRVGIDMALKFLRTRNFVQARPR